MHFGLHIAVHHYMDNCYYCHFLFPRMQKNMFETMPFVLPNDFDSCYAAVLYRRRNESYIITGEIALAAQAIPPIPTHFSVAARGLSVCLSHSCPLLELFGTYACGVRWPPGEGEIWRSSPAAKTCNFANCCCHLASTNEERFRLLPNYFGAC